jgi:hypothetical protein
LFDPLLIFALAAGRRDRLANASKKLRETVCTFDCDEKLPSVTDLPIDRIGQAVQPTPAQRAALDEFLKVTPTGRVR